MIVHGYKNRASGANFDAEWEGANSSKEVHVSKRALASLDYKEDLGTGATETDHVSKLRSCGA